MRRRLLEPNKKGGLLTAFSNEKNFYEILFGFRKAFLFKFRAHDIIAFFGVAENDGVAICLAIPIQNQGAIIIAVVFMFVAAFRIADGCQCEAKVSLIFL